MNKHIRRNPERNPNLDPNMLLILLLILSAYSRKPLYFCDKESLIVTHNKPRDNEAYKGEMNFGENIGVLNISNSSQKNAGSDSNNEIDGVNLDGDGGLRNLQNTSPNKIDIEENHTINNVFGNISQDMTTVDYANPDLKCGELLDSGVVPEYPSRLIKPEADYKQLVVNVPVLISQFEIEFACESTVELEYPATDIKHIKKNVFLEQCRLLPKVNKLFLSGFVRKNIEYSTCKQDKLKNTIRHMTIEVPFKCTTKIEYLTNPVISSNTEQLEIETIGEDGMGSDLSEKEYVMSEYFNEKIYCKLISNEIRELDRREESECDDLNENNEIKSSVESEKVFKSLTEKMVVDLRLKLIQEQQININR